MPVHLPLCFVVVFLCVFIVLPSPTCAQRLDFGPPTPKPGDGRAVLALADRLDDEAENLEKHTPERTFRHLAAALLRTGEGAGPDGSEAILAALTLAANRDELDTLLRAHDHPTRTYIAQLLETADPSILPREVDLLLRDALAPLTADTTCGWWSFTEPDAVIPARKKSSLLRSRIPNRHLTDAASTALAEMLDLLDAALGEPSYQHGATEWISLLANATAALDDPPDWLDMPARDQLRADLSVGLSLCLDAPAEARTSLTRTATLGHIIQATEALDSTWQSRKLRSAVNRLTAAAEGDPKRDPAAVARISETYLRALDLLAAEGRLPAPTDLVRQVRPMRKPLIASHRRAVAAMVRVLPMLLDTPDPMTEPSILAAMHALSQTADDLRIPAELSALLATWHDNPARPVPVPSREPLATRKMGPLAERIRALGVSLGQEKETENALEQLRTLAEFADFMPELPGEHDLRAHAGAPTWRRVTGNQTDRLLFLIEQSRERCLDSAATDRFLERRAEDHAQMRTLATLLPLLRDGVAIEELRLKWTRKTEPLLNTWPGFELTRPGLDTLAAGLTTRLAELAALAARNDDHARVFALAESLRADYAAALLVARLNTTAQRAHPCTIAEELGLGTPAPTAWLAEHRHALAALCRSTYEAAAAEGQQQDLFLAHANRLAFPILETQP